MISRGLMEKEHGRIMRRLFELRQEGDYEVVAFYDDEEVDEAIKDAEKFLNDAEKVVNRLLSDISH